ncbi:MAG: hypothetical protein L3K04_03970 [Thermoplasmata archaeon]|nr:hypothetical protein [Thermoplasmata archaeon]MCI4341368.1 hypothetical protein [Thermoplasmata archaeon]
MSSIRFAQVPAPLSFLKDRRFHSSGCAVAFLSDLSRGVERKLVILASRDQPLPPRESLQLLVEAIDAVLCSP